MLNNVVDTGPGDEEIPEKIDWSEAEPDFVRAEPLDEEENDEEGDGDWDDGVQSARLGDGNTSNGTVEMMS